MIVFARLRGADDEDDEVVGSAASFLTGLGGGVVLVPLLTVVFGVDIRYAMGASLVSVINRAFSFAIAASRCSASSRSAWHSAS